MAKDDHKTAYKGRVKRPPSTAGFWQKFWWDFTHWTTKHKFWQRLGLGILAFVVLSFGTMYGIAQWYINKHKNTPLVVGATFIPDYARYFDLDPKETMAAIIDDLGIERIRLVSYWDIIEANEGTYNFEELDWQMAMALEKNVKVSLSIGLRQPRWPECHIPSWAEKLPGNEWEPYLFSFLEETVNRYKDHPSLESYQLENEHLLDEFGICPEADKSKLRDRLQREFELVKRVDPDHTLVISRSNNFMPSWPHREPRPDLIGISVYKRVWDKYLTHRYFDYPLPAWYYAFLAGAAELATGRDTFIHELQTEAWTPSHIGGTKTVTTEEQYKSLSPERLRDRIAYGKATGMRTIDLWGVEWWYWRKKVHNDPGLWNAAISEINKVETENAKLKN